MWRITQQDLNDLAVGAAFLGTGGGGDPYIGRLMVQAAMEEGREVVKHLRATTPVVVPIYLAYRNPEHRELLLSGLRLAASETT